jgi:hypothetical protein
VPDVYDTLPSACYSPGKTPGECEQLRGQQTEAEDGAHDHPGKQVKQQHMVIVGEPVAHDVE